ncbi:restriction endonuclease [Fusobacterium sp. PH5-44]|uniref:restriction endonuclease n=1 Tax=unclassified Fusobacterium TaxID=2648384 RepID=UPI003D191708
MQGKYWRIYLEKEFYDLLSNIKEGKLIGEIATSNTRLESCVTDGIIPHLDEICKEIQKAHVGKYLEELIETLLKKISNVKNVERKSGSSDKGGDLICVYDTGMTDIFGIEKYEKCAIQVKSYEGTIDVETAIKDLERVFEYDPQITCGIIMTTALKTSERFESALDGLIEKTGKDISIIYGKDLAKWIIKYS